MCLRRNVTGRKFGMHLGKSYIKMRIHTEELTRLEIIAALKCNRLHGIEKNEVNKTQMIFPCILIEFDDEEERVEYEIPLDTVW